MLFFIKYAKDGKDPNIADNSASEPQKSEFFKFRLNNVALKETLSNPAVWATALMYFGVKFIRYTFLFWLPLYLSQSFGYSNEVAGYTSSVFEAAGFAGVILSGYISDKLYRSRRFPVGALFMFVLAVVFAVHPFLSKFGYWGIVAAVALVGVFTYGPDALMSGATAQDLGKENAGITAGFINGVGSAGQIVSPYAVAFISDKFGWPVLFEVFIGVSVISGLLLCTHWNYGKKAAFAPDVLKVETVNV